MIHNVKDIVNNFTKTALAAVLVAFLLLPGSCLFTLKTVGAVAATALAAIAALQVVLRRKHHQALLIQVIILPFF